MVGAIICMYSNFFCSFFTTYMYFVAICDEECINGQCILPDECQCDDGWTNDTCDIGMLLV